MAKTRYDYGFVDATEDDLRMFADIDRKVKRNNQFIKQVIRREILRLTKNGGIERGVIMRHVEEVLGDKWHYMYEHWVDCALTALENEGKIAFWGSDDDLNTRSFGWYRLRSKWLPFLWA
jgi:hypothetical protein